jgi:Transposase DDE domain
LPKHGCVSSKLAEQLFEDFGIAFFAKPKSNIKNRLMRLTDKLLSRQRSIIDQFKKISQIEHSRHRSPINFLVNLVCGLIADYQQPKKPSLNLDWALPPAA